MSCRFTTGVLALIERDRRHVTLPRIGTIRTLESGGQRYAFNWGQALMEANLTQRRAEKSYGVPPLS
jgi:hypothetical protein